MPNGKRKPEEVQEKLPSRKKFIDDMVTSENRSIPGMHNAPLRASMNERFRRDAWGNPYGDPGYMDRRAKRRKRSR